MRQIVVLFLCLFCVPSVSTANDTFARNSVIGFDFSFIGALARESSSERHIAGTLTYAKMNSNWELAFPFFHAIQQVSEEFCCQIHIKRIDIQLRRYLSKKQLGPYLGVLFRHSDVIGRDFIDHSQRISLTRMGPGIVVGTKLKLYKNIYWGTNFHSGVFLSDGPLLADGSGDVSFLGPSENHEKYFFNIELLKVGARF